jgi:membrane protein YqaA with SNARE-associated domain
MEIFFQTLLTNLSQPEFGLAVLFAASLLAATLLPLGSEPVLLGLIAINPSLLWPALLVATLGNTLGGVVGWWMGLGAERWISKQLNQDKVTHHVRALRWLQRVGPVACLGAWLPIIGDPLCVVAGYLRLPLLPCIIYMAIGKALRYGVLVFGWQWLV